MPDPTRPALRPVVDDGEPLELLVAAWLAAHPSPETRRAYRRDLQLWAGWCHRHGVDPLAPRRTHVDLWLAALREAGAAPTTIVRRRTGLSSFLGWCADEGHAGDNPAARVRLPKPPRPDMPSLTRHELHRFLAAAEHAGNRPDEVALVMLLALCALRISEACGADVDDLTVTAWTPQLRVHGKGQRDRTVVVPPRAMAWVEQAGDGRTGGALLRNRAGNRMTRCNAGPVITRTANAAAMADRQLTPHALRRSAVEIALEAGVPIRDVQLWVGHEHLSTTEWYDRRPMTPDRSPGWHVQAAVA